MAYGEKYKYYFYWDHNSSNNYYKVSILVDGYASTVTTLIPSTNSFIQSFKGQKDSINQIVIGGEATFGFIADKADVSDLDSDLLESDYKDVIVKLIQDPDGTPVVKWTGLMLPANATRDWMGNTYTYSLSAVDGLADLKNVKYSTDGTESGSPYTGFENILTIIKTAISKVSDFTELQLDFRIQLGIFSDQMTSAENAFKENEIAQDLFYENKDGDIEFDTCYTVLEKILNSFYCSMAQSDGYYWIWNNWEDSSYYFEYDWATLTQQSRTSNDRRFTVTNLKQYGRGNLTKTPSFSKYNITLYNRNYDPELAINGGFDSNITGWTNGDADDSSNPWTVIVWDSNAGGTLKASWAGAASSGDYSFHSSAGITLVVGSGAQTVTVQWKLEYNQSAPGGLTLPSTRARLWNGTDLYTTGTLQFQTIAKIGGFYVFTETFTVTGLTVASNYLDVEIRITDASTTSAVFYFDNISVLQGSEETPTDWIYRGFRTSGNQQITEENTIYIAEMQESDNDSCAIKDSGGTYTSTWSRYGKTDNDPLITILLQNAFNDNNTFMSYIRTTSYDPSETINIHSMPGGSSFDEYKIVGMTKDYRNATVELQIKEIYIAPSDISFSLGAQKLSTQYGQDI